MITVMAILGAKALWLLYAWLVSAIVASYASERKGYGPKAGLATGLLLLEDVAAGPEPRQGRLRIPDAPGLGVVP